MFIRAATHRAIVREKDKQIAELLSLVQSQSERLLVVAGYRPLLPQRGPAPVAATNSETERLRAELDALDLVES